MCRRWMKEVPPGDRVSLNFDLTEILAFRPSVWRFQVARPKAERPKFRLFDEKLSKLKLFYSNDFSSFCFIFEAKLLKTLRCRQVTLITSWKIHERSDRILSKVMNLLPWVRGTGNPLVFVAFWSKGTVTVDLGSEFSLVWNRSVQARFWSFWPKFGGRESAKLAQLEALTELHVLTVDFVTRTQLSYKGRLVLQKCAACRAAVKGKTLNQFFKKLACRVEFGFRAKNLPRGL